MANSDKPDASSRNPQVEALAKLLHESARDALFERVGRIQYDSSKFEAFFVSLNTESDRALAIVAFSFVDEQLKDLLIRAMDLTTVGGPDPLFGSLGPLATASARLKLAAALRWIHPDVYHDLDLIRKIRNEFAHKPFLKGFDHARILGYLSSMHRFEETVRKKFGDDARDPTTLSLREKFHIRCIVATMSMVAEMLTAPIALSMGLHPFEALAASGNDQPPLRDLRFAASRAMIELVRAQERKAGA